MGKLVRDIQLLDQKVLYHITPTRLVSDVLRFGLLPRTSKLPDTSGAGVRGRIYLAYYQEDLRELLDDFRELKGRGHEPFTMLEVRIPPKIRFYEDEDTFGSDTYIYTASKIPSKYIRVMGPVVSRKESPEYKEALARYGARFARSDEEVE